jgi:hypothetical protein
LSAADRTDSTNAKTAWTSVNLLFVAVIDRNSRILAKK